MCMLYSVCMLVFLYFIHISSLTSIIDNAQSVTREGHGGGAHDNN